MELFHFTLQSTSAVLNLLSVYAIITLNTPHSFQNLSNSFSRIEYNTSKYMLFAQILSEADTFLCRFPAERSKTIPTLHDNDLSVSVKTSADVAGYAGRYCRNHRRLDTTCGTVSRFYFVTRVSRIEHCSHK